MTPEQINLVQHSWQRIHPKNEEAAEIFYARLFSLDPSLQDLFKGDMLVQRTMFISILGMAVSSLARPEKLIPTVRALGKRHAGYGVQPSHYELVGDALLWTFEKTLGEAFTVEVREAWSDAYLLLADTMKQGAQLAA